jgi:hypothetical protein
MAINLCVLRSGGEYRPEHAQWLARQIPGLVCLSDVPVPGVKTLQLQHNWPGWWAKMEMFRPDIEGDAWMFDLDTVVINLPDEPTQTTVLSDFTDRSLTGSGFMFVTAADRKRVWDAWIRDPDKHMQDNQFFPKLGDQGFLHDYIGSKGRWDHRVYSYKMHCLNGLPADASVVCFHGHPRPWHVIGRDWIPSFQRPDGDCLLQHPGARIIVMGGSDDIERDLIEIGSRKGDVVISTNAHGVDLRRPDYLLAMDTHHLGTGEPMGDYLRARSDAPIISVYDYAQYRIHGVPDCEVTKSGLVAMWVAYRMGARVIHLAGMRGNEGDRDYRMAVDQMAKHIHTDVRVAADSMLAEVFPVRRNGERFPRRDIDIRLRVLADDDGKATVRAIKDCHLEGGVTLKAGESMRAHISSVQLLLRHRMMEVIDE